MGVPRNPSHLTHNHSFISHWSTTNGPIIVAVLRPVPFPKCASSNYKATHLHTRPITSTPTHTHHSRSTHTHHPLQTRTQSWGGVRVVKVGQAVRGAWGGWTAQSAACPPLVTPQSESPYSPTPTPHIPPHTTPTQGGVRL